MCVFNGLFGGPVNCPQLCPTHVCRNCAKSSPELRGELTTLIMILIKLLLYTRIPPGVSQRCRGGLSRPIILLLYYYIIIILLYDYLIGLECPEHIWELRGILFRGVYDPHMGYWGFWNPQYRSGYYATTDCVSVFDTDWQFLLMKPSASNFTSGLLKSAWVIIHWIADSLLMADGVSLSTMLVCFLITNVLIRLTRSWANLIFVSPCGDVDTPTTLYVFASILLLALLSLVVVYMTIVYVYAQAHTVVYHYSILYQTVKQNGIGTENKKHSISRG